MVHIIYILIILFLCCFSWYLITVAESIKDSLVKQRGENRQLKKRLHAVINDCRTLEKTTIISWKEFDSYSDCTKVPSRIKTEKANNPPPILRKTSRSEPPRRHTPSRTAVSESYSNSSPSSYSHSSSYSSYSSDSGSSSCDSGSSSGGSSSCD